MHFIHFLNQTKGGLVVKHLFLVVLTVVVLFLLGMAFLYKYTDHGVEVEVPNLRGIYVDEAKTIVESLELNLVVSDSLHQKDMPAGQIIDQTPKVGINAKRGSTIYVVMNSLCPQVFPLPDVRNMSLRQAKSILQSMGYAIVGLDSVAYAYKGIVVNVVHNGKILEPGERIAENSQLRIQIGSGSLRTNTRTSIPDVVGLSLVEARDMIEQNHLVLGTYDYDVEPTAENISQYVVFEQAPQAGKMVTEGEIISLLLTQKDSINTPTDDNQDDDEFF